MLTEGLADNLCAAALPDDGGGRTDRQLLESYLTRRDEAAFATLVHRHAAMVLGVCRRVLRSPQDVEDAFQATFLVLVRKAACIQQRDLLGNWLYGVAYRTALDARAASIRRQVRERSLLQIPEPQAREGADDCSDLRPLLDQELSRLPDKYRVPVVLCDLEARTLRDVARQLGIPAGTLSGRLATARRMLASRLARRGVVLSAGALTVALSQAAATASVPAPLVASTVQTAMVVATEGLVSAPVATLAARVLKAMLLKTLKTAGAVVLAIVVILGAAVAVVQADRKANQAGALRVFDLDDRGRHVAWSPDGKTVAVVTKVEKSILGLQYDRRGSALKLWDVDKGQLRQTVAEDSDKGLAFSNVVFSTDGKTIAATVAGTQEVVDPKGGRELHIGNVVKLWDAQTLALKRTLGGDSQLVCVALSPDGKRAAAGSPAQRTVQLWNTATGKLERRLRTGEVQPWSVAFSPDGKTVVVGGQKADHSGDMTLWNVTTGKAKHSWKLESYVNAVAFSPDGKMVAASTGAAVILVGGTDKGNVIASLKGYSHGHRTIAFSPDSKIVAVGGADGKVRLWDVPSGKLRQTLQGHTAEVYSIAFAPDGKTLVSVSQDETMRLWRITKEKGSQTGL